MLSDVKNAVCNKWLFLTCLIVLFVLLRACEEPIKVLIEYGSSIDYLMFITYPSAFSGLPPFAVLFCIAPYACSFFDEWKNKYSLYAMLHTSQRRYICSKIIAVFLSGALALMIPIAIVFLVGYLCFEPVSAGAVSDYYKNTYWHGIINAYGGEVVLLLRIALAGLHGGIWALAGLFSSCLFRNKLAAVVAPFVLYYSLWALFLGSKYCPVFYLNADYSFLPSLGFVLCSQCIYLLVFALLCYVGMKRRCRHV